MKLAEFLTKERILLDVSCSDWKEAVQVGCGLLLREDCIGPEYTEAILRHHEEMGPYMVVAPGIMFAHARPEEGAKKIGISLVRLKEPIVFGNETNDPVSLVLTLATTDNTAHLTLLAGLMSLLSDETDMKRVMQVQTVEEVTAIIEKYA